MELAVDDNKFVTARCREHLTARMWHFDVAMWAEISSS